LRAAIEQICVKFIWTLSQDQPGAEITSRIGCLWSSALR